MTTRLIVIYLFSPLGVPGGCRDFAAVAWQRAQPALRVRVAEATP